MDERRSAARTARSRTRGQRGAGLIEVLVATAIAVPLTLASALGLMTSVRSSDEAAHRQELNVALTNASERLRTLPYLPCGTAEDYQRQYRSSAPRTDRDLLGTRTRFAAPLVDEVRYWNDAKQAYVGHCDRDGGAQQLLLTVISDRLGTATGSVVLTSPELDGTGRS